MSKKAKTEDKSAPEAAPEPEGVPPFEDKDLVPFTPAERVETLIDDLNARPDFNTTAVQNAVTELRNTLASLKALP